MVLKSHLLGIVLGLHNRLDGAATFLAGEAGFLDAVEGAESAAYDLVSLLQKEHGADGRIDAAGHSQ